MTAPPIRYPLARLGRAWLLTGVTDGLFACVSAVAFGSTLRRLWQGVASTVLGPRAFEGGGWAVAVGVLLHFGVALGWSAVFLALAARWPALRARLAAPGGVVAVAAVYGPLVWLVMSLVVVPLLVRRPPALTARWWVQLVGHAVFVGLPIVWGVTGGRAALDTPADAALASRA